MLLQHIHEPHDMLVGKIRLLIIGIQPIPGTILGTGIKNPGVCQEPIDVIAVKGHLPVSGDLGKEIFQIQLPHNVLQEKVTGINGGRLGSFPVCLFDSLIKITGKFNL